MNSNRRSHPLAVTAAVLLTALIALPLAGCGTYRSWTKGREARALEEQIQKQRANLRKMNSSQLERAETESRERAIAQYEKILREYSDVGRGEMDEALYLLGRLLFDREQRQFEQSQQSFEQARLRAEASGAAAPEEPKPRYPSARTVYERLLREFPDSQFREDTLYDLGYISFEEGDRAGGAKLFEALVAEKPRSRYAPEVQFRLGEWHFESYRLPDAEERYRAVLAFGQSEYTEKALFKLGWVYYNVDQYDEAKRVLAELLDRQSAKIAKAGGEFAPPPILFFPGPRRAALERVMDADERDLYEETLEIIARVYSESGGADALVAFLRTKQTGPKPPPYAPPLMHRLALVEKERSNFDQAARAYQLLLDAFPTYRDAPKIETEWVRVLIEQKDLERAARVREALLAKYDQGSPWARANPEQEARDAALKVARKGLSWSIRYFHARGLERQKEGVVRPEELVHAIELYERYLARFPDGKPSYDRRFRYAQALFAAGEYRKAGDVFRVVAADPAFAEKREEAAFARILSVEKLTEGRSAPYPKDVIAALVPAYDDYIALNPASDKVAQLIFKQGQLWFGAEQYPQAIAAFERLIRERPTDPLAVEANDLVAQAHYRLGEFGVAEKWSEKALVQASPSNPLGTRRAEVENLYAVTMFKQGEKADEEKKWDEARNHYLRLVSRLPQWPTMQYHHFPGSEPLKGH